jgi:sugar/nucleoside kinase (ribokinase family)
MADQLLDVVGIGNAIVDVLSHAEESYLTRHDLAKGTMRLIDADEAERLYAEMGPAVECSGGSAANTTAGLASFGGKAAFVGKTCDDQLGVIFGHDLRATGVEFETAMTSDGAATARCLIFVTPDAQRTMNTFLGACAELGPDDIDPATVARAQVTYLEGYLWDPPAAKDAFRKAMHLAHQAGRKVALTLSDPFCVERWRGEFLDLVEREVDILFANEEELKSLYSVDDFDDALQAARGHCEVAALTRSEKGSVVLTDHEIHVIDAEPVSQVVDTTGAGDLYAAGFLYGLTRDQDLRTCAILGGVAAAEVIGHFGARPERPLAELARARLG